MTKKQDKYAEAHKVLTEAGVPRWLHWFWIGLAQAAKAYEGKGS